MKIEPGSIGTCRSRPYGVRCCCGGCSHNGIVSPGSHLYYYDDYSCSNWMCVWGDMFLRIPKTDEQVIVEGSFEPSPPKQPHSVKNVSSISQTKVHEEGKWRFFLRSSSTRVPVFEKGTVRYC